MCQANTGKADPPAKPSKLLDLKGNFDSDKKPQRNILKTRSPGVPWLL